MITGIICDGSAESIALRGLVERMACESFSPINPIYADMQPMAPAAQIVKAAEPKIKVLLARRVSKIIVILDKDGFSGDVHARSREIESAFLNAGYGNVNVVIKVSCVENWLLSDVDAVVRALSRRVNFSASVSARLRGPDCDMLDAQRVLNSAITGGYRKSIHPPFDF